MERFSAASEPVSSERLKFSSWTLRPSAADAFCSMVGRNSLTGIKNGATRTKTTSTPTTMRMMRRVLFMTTSDPAGTSEDWVRRENGTTDAARGGWLGFRVSRRSTAFRRLHPRRGGRDAKKRNRLWKGVRVCVATRLDAAPILAGEEERGMANFLEYNPEQAYLLPPTVREVLGEGHLCFFVHGAVEKLDLQEFEAGYSDEGHPAYHPALLLKVWLYAYALGMTSSRRLEQRIREDLAFRYLAGGAQPDFWALNEFRKRHGRAMNDIFTQVVELARSLGLGKLGHVAIDSTRIAANAATSATETLEKLRAERAKIRKNIRRWQQQCASEDPNEGAGLEVARAAMEKLEGQLREIPVRLQRLKKSGMRKLSRTDADSRFLPDRRGFTLGYTATLAVSDDHLIVAQQVSRELNDNGLLVPMEIGRAHV